MEEKKNYIKILTNFCNDIDDNLAELTEEEINQDLIQLGVDPNKIAQDVSDILTNALNSFKINKLDIAKKKRLNTNPKKNEILTKILTFTREALIEQISKYNNADTGYAFREQDLDTDKIDTEDLRVLLEGLILTKQFKNDE